jgi:hypothetical protein
MHSRIVNITNMLHRVEITTLAAKRRSDAPKPFAIFVDCI